MTRTKWTNFKLVHLLRVQKRKRGKGLLTCSACKELFVGPRSDESDGDLAELGKDTQVGGLQELEIRLVLVVKHQQHVVWPRGGSTKREDDQKIPFPIEILYNRKPTNAKMMNFRKFLNRTFNCERCLPNISERRPNS